MFDNRYAIIAGKARYRIFEKLLETSSLDGWRIRRCISDQSALFKNARRIELNKRSMGSGPEIPTSPPANERARYHSITVCKIKQNWCKLYYQNLTKRLSWRYGVNRITYKNKKGVTVRWAREFAQIEI